MNSTEIKKKLPSLKKKVLKVHNLELGLLNTMHKLNIPEQLSLADFKLDKKLHKLYFTAI